MKPLVQFAVNSQSDKRPNEFNNDFIRTPEFVFMLLSNAEEGSEYFQFALHLKGYLVHQSRSHKKRFLKETLSAAGEISEVCNPISRNINLSQHAVKAITANRTTNPEIGF